MTRRKSLDAAEKVAQETPKKPPTGPVVFKRIDPTKFDNKIATHFQDNTFEAKAKFGETGDSYGTWSNDKLKVVVGKNFTKEKNKMKNRNTHASGRFN